WECGELARERRHLGGDLHCQRAEQVLLAREVEVEGSVRRAGGLHDVVDAGSVEAALREHGRTGLEQPTARPLAAGGRGIARDRHRSTVSRQMTPMSSFGTHAIRSPPSWVARCGLASAAEYGPRLRSL